MSPREFSDEDDQGAGLDVYAYIREHLDLLPVPAFPEILLYTPHRSSRLSRLSGADPDPSPPYWAYVWGGGAALVRHLRHHPELVAGRRVLDLGAGSGIVGIAAARAGAGAVVAAEVDAIGVAAIALNASANGVVIDVVESDLTSGPVPDTDIILVGDLFYDPDLALRVTGFLERCVKAGVEVAIGDPFRAHLPTARLEPIAAYDVADFGESGARPGGVFKLLV